MGATECDKDPIGGIVEYSSRYALITVSDKHTLILDKLNVKSQLGNYWTATKGRDIALRHIVQLKSTHVEREHMDACRDLIIYLTQVFYETEEANDDEEVEMDNDEEEGKKQKKSDLLWLMQKLNSVAAFENSDMPTQVVRREIVVELFITVMSMFKENTRHLNVMLEVFYREAAAADDSKQTPVELKRAVYKGLSFFIRKYTYNPTNSVNDRKVPDHRNRLHPAVGGGAASNCRASI